MATGTSARSRFWVAVAILCAPPLFLGIQGTRNLDWPDDPDLFRETAQAQSFADGHLLDDPYYLGEWIWYPPLVPGVVAALSRVTGSPVHTVYTRAGAYLNMLGPVVFAALVARCFGSLAGLVALTDFLYRSPRGPSGATPFYSTLLYSGNFAQALFYLTLLSYVSLSEKRPLRYVLTGLLLGLTFLGHAAPFVVLSVLFLVESARAATRDPRTALKRYSLLFATAALAATPLLVSIVGRYHLEIQNPAPTQWVAWSATWTATRRQVDAHAWAACVALAVLWVRGPREGAWVVSAWVAGALALVGHSFAAAAWGWPTVVPRHHLMVYVRVAQPVLIGYGASALWSGARRWIDRSRLMARPRATLAREATIWLAMAGGAALLVFLVVLPAQARRAGSLRTGLIHDSTVQAGLDAYRWMRSALRSDDVVLATGERGLMVVGPAGAKVVAIQAVFGNLYVDHARRVRARNEMFSALRRGDEAGFEALADEYSVTHVLWVGVDGPWFDHAPFRSLALAFDDRKVRIYRRTRRPSDDAT
jgi:hypothetical protein